jgi:hypothetical protein
MIRIKITKILLIHKYLFLYYLPDLIKKELLMKFSIECNKVMETQELIGCIMKLLWLMSLIAQDI